MKTSLSPPCTLLSLTVQWSTCRFRFAVYCLVAHLPVNDLDEPHPAAVAQAVLGVEVPHEAKDAARPEDQPVDRQPLRLQCVEELHRMAGGVAGLHRAVGAQQHHLLGGELGHQVGVDCSNRGVGWGEVINGGFGLYIDGSEKSGRAIESMIPWDVENGIARRSWARNDEAMWTIKRAMDNDSNLNVTLPNIVDESILKNLFDSR